MINSLIQGILSVITNVINFIFLPINLIFSSIFPDLSIQLGNFNDNFGSMLNRFGSYIGSIIPPGTKTIILLWLTFLISYYGIIWTYWLAVRTWTIIKKVKFW